MKNLTLLLVISLFGLSSCGSPESPVAALFEEEITQVTLDHKNGKITDRQLTARMSVISTKRQSSIRLMALLTKMHANEEKLAEELGVPYEHFKKWQKDTKKAREPKKWSVLGFAVDLVFNKILGVNQLGSRNRYRAGFKKRR